MLRDPDGLERKFIHDVLGPSAGKVLEVGCGDGRLTEDLSGVSSSIFALDPDPDSLEEARHLKGNGISLILGSGEHLPLADKSFDTVVFSLSLHHHHDPDNALSQARRVLREGGRILVLEPESESPINRCFKLIHNENEAYEKAAAAVNRCGADLAGWGTITSMWRFDDFMEMVNHLYSYFDLEPEPSPVKAMENILGSKVKDRPLDVEDSTRWWLLTSASST